MRINSATKGLESLNWDYGELAEAAGEGKALETVARYLTNTYHANPFVQGSRLVSSFLEQAGAQARELIDSAHVPTPQPRTPVLRDEEFHDPTDKGLTPPEWIGRQRIYLRRAGRRGKRNG